MCKILAFTNMRKLDIETTANKLGNILLDLEKDGFGYSVQGEQGQFGEKCIASKFNSRLKFQNNTVLPFTKKKYESFGTQSKLSGPGIFHGRTSTNDVNLINCHPMRKNGHSLIHNGVVSYLGPEYIKQTTNDSEDVLQLFTQGIDKVEQHLTGYYAFANISPDGKLHIVRDRIASLYIAWAPKLETFIIATTDTLIERVAKTLKIKIELIEEISDDIYLVFNGNELVHQQDIKSQGIQNEFEADNTGRSLGNIIDASIGGSLNGRWLERDPEDEEAMEEFYDEIRNMDDTYSIFDKNENPVSIERFRRMTTQNKLNCLIIRMDGSIVEPGFPQQQRLG